MSASARFDLKLDSADKELFTQASALMGTSLAGFVRAAAKEKAHALLEREARISVSRDDFEAFTKALDQAFEPNEALSQALAEAQRVKRA